jgi:hypothetical protein
MNMMSKIKDNLASLSFMLVIPLLSSIYVLLNNADRGAQILITDLDKRIPFVPEFIVPYVLWYPFILFCLIYFCFKDKKVYKRTLISISLGMVISYIIFYVFQTHVPRPALEGNDIFTQWVRKIYEGDNPYNCFPSLHVLESYLMVKGAYALENRRPEVTWTVNIMAFFIILSTQFIKQHVLMDILGAVYLGEIIFNMEPTLERIFISFTKKQKAQITTNL